MVTTPLNVDGNQVQARDVGGVAEQEGPQALVHKCVHLLRKGTSRMPADSEARKHRFIKNVERGEQLYLVAVTSLLQNSSRWDGSA
jgi:hypothetical protein